MQCSKCNLVFVFPLPSAEQQKKWYDDSYEKGVYKIFSESENLRKMVNKKRFEDISKFNTQGKLLDVGTSTGIFLDIAESHGLETYGVELSSESFEKIKSTHKVFNNTLEKVNFQENFFDVITMFDVIEHLIDPNSSIKEISRIIKSEGLLIISTPDISCWHSKIMGKKWAAISPTEHLNYFSPKSIKFLLEKHGFTIIELRKDLKNFTLQGVFDMASFYSPKIYKFFTVFKPLIPKNFLNKKRTFYFGDSFVVAKKTENKNN